MGGASNDVSDASLKLVTFGWTPGFHESFTTESVHRGPFEGSRNICTCLFE